RPRRSMRSSWISCCPGEAAWRFFKRFANSVEPVLRKYFIPPLTRPPRDDIRGGGRPAPASRRLDDHQAVRDPSTRPLGQVEDPESRVPSCYVAGRGCNDRSTREGWRGDGAR